MNGEDQYGSNPELAELMQRITRSFEAIEKSIAGMNEYWTWLRARTEAEIAARQQALQAKPRAASPTAMQGYLSGRWPRRDGDGFSTPSRLQTAIDVDTVKHGDHSPGNIRSPDER